MQVREENHGGNKYLLITAVFDGKNEEDAKQGFKYKTTGNRGTK